MRQLVITEFMSLDGVIENPGWTMPYWSDEIAAFKGEETLSSDALLLGRVTYEGFASAWPQRTDDGAEYFNGVRKYVVSTTLRRADWSNSVLISDDVVNAITELKQQDGQDIMVHGSANLAQTLMEHRLVDRYRLLLYPVVLGSGQRLFREGIPGNLKLISAQPFSTGVVGLIYEPDRA